MSIIKVGDKDGNTVYYQTIKSGSVDDPFLPVVVDFKTEVTRGNISGSRVMSAMGERISLGTTTQGEDIWRGNDLSPAPSSSTSIPIPATAGEQMTIVSENDADNGGTATGVLTLRIEYLDDTGAEQTEDITMNGTTGVDTTAVNIRFVQDMYSLTVGTNGVCEGNIKIYKKGDPGLVYNMIFIGGNKSLVPHRMVPLGKSLILHNWHCTEAQGKRVNFRIRSTDMNGVIIPGVYCFKDTMLLKQDSLESTVNVKIPELSIIKISGWSIIAGGEASVSWEGILLDN